MFLSQLSGTLNSMGKSTIKDVALNANVSIGTVSRYINGFKIKDFNRLAIEQAIEELNYTTDQFARSMKTKKSFTVGLIVSGYDTFNTNVISTMVKIFREKNYILMTYHHESNSEIFDNAFSFFKDRQFDGIAMSGVDGRLDQVEDYISQGKAISVFNNDIKSLDIDRVLVNNKDATYKAICYLIQMNHKKIGFIAGNLNESTAIDRLSGYKEALEDKGIHVNEAYIVNGNWNEISGYFGTKELLKNKDRPTAIFASNYVITMGVLKALKEMKIRVPEDISVISFDDHDFFEILNPSITAISQPSEDVGLNVANLLLQRITGEYEGSGRTIMLNCQLILRDSVQYCINN